MNSRMDKYRNADNIANNRTEKNKSLYNDKGEMDAEYIDINNANVYEITDQSFKNVSRSNYHKMKDLDINPLQKDSVPQEPNYQKRVERIYDIDEILKQAKENKKMGDELEKKRLINTEYNILTKLDIDKINSAPNLNSDNIRQIVDDVYEKEYPKTDNNRELFHDLVDSNPNNDTNVSKTDIIEEIKTDNTIPADDNTLNQSLSIKEQETKEVIVSDESDESMDEENTKNPVLIIVIIIVILILIAGAYFLLKYFGTI